MERSGTLSEPSDNSTTPYIKKETNPFGSASSFRIWHLPKKRPASSNGTSESGGKLSRHHKKNLQRAPFIT